MAKTYKYTYKDFRTLKVRRTNGKFIGWSKPTGPLNVPYAGFRRKKSVIWVPIYLLPKETILALEEV